MPRYLAPADMTTREGRRRAARHLYLTDHGALRALYDNTHWIDERMARSYQPSPARVADWARQGIRTVVNLRGTRWEPEQPGWYWLEVEACRAHGLAHHDLRAFSRDAPRADFVLGLDALLGQIAYPAVMHCKSGADRAGLAASLYAFLHGGQPLAQARRQLSLRYGHVRQGKTGVLGAFWDAYEEAVAADGVAPAPDHFRDWVRTRYDRQAVTRGFETSTLGRLLTDRVLRRE